MEDILIRLMMDMDKARETRAHPGDLNSLIEGVLSGLNFGEAVIKSGNRIDTELVLIFCGVGSAERNLNDLLKNANDYLGGDQIFNSRMYSNLSYRTGLSKTAFAEGFRLGFEHVGILFDSVYTAEAGRVKAINRLDKFLSHLRSGLQSPLLF